MEETIKLTGLMYVSYAANSSDPSYFSVQLLNANNSELNGNFQIGNALVTSVR